MTTFGQNDLIQHVCESLSISVVKIQHKCDSLASWLEVFPSAVGHDVQNDDESFVEKG